MQPILIHYNQKKPKIPTGKVKPKKQSVTEIGLHDHNNRKQPILSRFFGCDLRHCTTEKLEIGSYLGSGIQL